MQHRHSFHAMGTDMLAVVETENDLPPVELTHVSIWFEEWEQILSRFRIDSELSRLNQTSDQPVPVSETLWEVFKAARFAEQTTNGLVTPTVASAVIEAGYDRNFDDLPREQFCSVITTPSMIDSISVITWDEVKHTICLPPNVKLDFGGIAKGWAAHQAMQRLQSLGPALIDAGGDIAISDELPNGELWKIGVADPLHAGEELEVLYLGHCGIATSGKDHRHWRRKNELRHHIIDPRTGLSAQTDVMTATVIASTVMEAEAAAKSALIRGSEAGLDWIESDPTLAGLLVLDDGQILYSQRMEQYL